MRKLPLLAAGIITVAITVGSLTPVTATGTGGGLSWQLYALHGIAYAVLAASLVLAWGCEQKQCWAAILVAAGYGAVIEVMQIPVPGRFFSLLDIAANTGGAVLAFTAYYMPWASTLRRRLP